ncbi:MAG TPA: TonB-dependent receptor [Negativicutes bacterium]|jgi:iron complex outermembrane receptor protein
MGIQSKSNKKKAIIQITALALSTSLFAGIANANAPQTDNPEYDLDQVLVTAQRYETRDVDTPATTSVYTNAQLRATGASSVLEALKFQEGLVYSTYGPSGASNSTMTSKLVIRGVTSGTLVLINGTPLNLRGLYNLEDIPVENVERVEIIRGGGSVLYGSEATGGVINIIMKKNLGNSVKVSGGNFGQQDHSLNLQAGKLGIGYDYQKWGDVGKISKTVTSGKEMDMYFPGLERNTQMLTYGFDDHLSLLYSHNDSENRYDYVFGPGYSVSGQKRYSRIYDDKKDFAQLQYNRDHIKGTLYFNQNKLNTLGTDYWNSGGTSQSGYPQYTNKTDQNRAYGLDVQGDWRTNGNKFLAGLTYQNEYYSPDIGQRLDYERNNYSLYGQWERSINDVNTLILSTRETWTENAPHGRNYDNLSSQAQFLHKLNENESLYANVGQSFKMPTFSQIYSTDDKLLIGNPDLKPQTGIHYETGWKRNSGGHAWKAAIFNYYIKDNISSVYTAATGQYKYTNEDLKNTGVELNCEIGGENDWTFNWGISYGNPQSRSTTKPYWDRLYGRWQLNGGMTYRHDRWRATLTGNYLTSRVMTPSSTPSYAGKPYLLTSLNVNYTLNKNQDVFFTVNNLMDRDDVISNSSSDYYYTPINVVLGYKSRF